MYSASDLKKGLKILIDGAPWVITEFEFCKPGKGTALYRCRMKNMITGIGMEKTYRPTDKENIEKTMRYINDLSKSVKFYLLHCNLDQNAANVAFDGMNNQ